MSYAYMTGGIVFICDDCTDSVDTREEDFKKAWDKAKGWAVMRHGRATFIHFCPACAGQYETHDNRRVEAPPNGGIRK